MAAKYELRSFSDPGSSENMGLKESGGCYIKTATGIVFFIVNVLYCCACFFMFFLIIHACVLDYMLYFFVSKPVCEIK